MSSRLDGSTGVYEWNRNWGAMANTTESPRTAIPPGMVQYNENVQVRATGILYPRRGLVSMSTTGTEPTVGVRYLFAERESATLQNLWAFCSDGAAAMVLHVFDGTTWNVIGLSDTVATLAEPMCVRYNGKVFIAYNSNVNRLHVDDGTSIRRVGIGQVAAPTVANQGGGAYPAVARYYRVAMAILDAASTVIASSEPGTASTVFTPSGAGLSARITKPATVDSATHWVIYASADNVTYYGLSAYLPVGTTTFDDTQIVGNYPTGQIAPIPGLSVPPPSCKFLATDGTRLLMAGAWETTASAGETTPSPKRVWFTRPIGALDIGDDESVTQTDLERYFIDVDDPEHSAITAMQCLNGITYVFFAEATWRLVPTGIDTVPYRTERVSAHVGAESQLATCIGATSAGEDAIYFYSVTGGICRITSSAGLEWMGPDVAQRSPVTPVTGVTLAYDRSRRDLWYLPGTGTVYYVAVDFLRKGEDGIYHGGTSAFGTVALVGTAVGVSYAGTFYLGGNVSGARLHSFSASASDDAGSAITVAVSGPLLGDGLSRYSFEEPTVQVGDSISQMTFTASYQDLYSPLVTNFRNVTMAATGLNGRGLLRIAGLTIDDTIANQGKLSGTVGATEIAFSSRIERMFMPYTKQDAL